MKYLEYILIAREHIVKYYKLLETFLLPVFKFLLGYIVFSGIFSIGLVSERVAGFTEGFTGTMLAGFFALMFTVLPMNMSWLLIILSLVSQFSANTEVAIALFIFLMFIYLFYARMAPRESVFIIITFLAFRYNVPYLVPMIAGLYFPLTTIFPIAIGVFLSSQAPLVFGLMTPDTPVALVAERELVDIILELPAAFSEVYLALITSLEATGAWVFTAVIFAMVIVLIHFVSRQAIDYSKQIAIGLGSVMLIFGFVVSVVWGTEQANVGVVILGTIVCAILALVATFFDMVLDYNRAESVQFEDENNFYHVRIIPKMNMDRSKRIMMRLQPEDTDIDEE